MENKNKHLYKCPNCFRLTFRKRDSYINHLKLHLNLKKITAANDDAEVKRMKLKIDIIFNLSREQEMYPQKNDVNDIKSISDQKEENASFSKEPGRSQIIEVFDLESPLSPEKVEVIADTLTISDDEDLSASSSSLKNNFKCDICKNSYDKKSDLIR